MKLLYKQIIVLFENVVPQFLLLVVPLGENVRAADKRGFIENS